MQTAKELATQNIDLFRSGIWKPRTRPGSFEGVGAPGLKWLKRVKEETGLKVTTEVAKAERLGQLPIPLVRQPVRKRIVGLRAFR